MLLFGFGEQWDLSLNSNTDLLHSHYYRGYTASINIPYGYWFYQFSYLITVLLILLKVIVINISIKV
nr:ShlB/FhaC/HecB family hemolysin secretion/activation protein [Proteus mirabilis]